MDNNDGSNICNICNKIYSSYKSLWNHNKKFHNENNLKTIPKQSQSNLKTIPIQSLNINTANTHKIIQCNFCEQIFTHRNNKYRHEKTCKNKIDKSIEDKKLEIILKKEEKEILKLKLKLQNSDKVNNVTLKKLNKKLMERNNLIKNSTVNSHNNTQNNTQVINNYNLISFGKENIAETSSFFLKKKEDIESEKQSFSDETLTLKDKKQIINAKYQCLEKLIEIVHCGKYDQFKNVIVINMKDNYMYKYEENKGQFILSTKNEVMHLLVDYRTNDLDVIYNDLIKLNKIDDKTKDIIEDFINRMLNIDKKHEDCEVSKFF
jgi:hypothetical protein